MIFMIFIVFLQKYPTIFLNIFRSLSSNLEALMLIPVASKRGNLNDYSVLGDLNLKYIPLEHFPHGNYG